MARPPRHRNMNVSGAIVTLALLTVACTAHGTPDEVTDTIAGDVVVFAAASLTDAFDELGEVFTDTNPGIRVLFNYAGSQTLAHQINEGAPADLFASANVAQMAMVSGASNVSGDPQVFATNSLAIAVEQGNPLGIADLADLAHPDVVLVLAAEQVPAGRYAREALRRAGIAVTPASLEVDVRAALAKVELGEADASIVYASDIAASDGRAEGITIPVEDNVTAAYPIAVLAQAANRSAADAFVAFVLNEDGQTILADYGFASP